MRKRKILGLAIGGLALVAACSKGGDGGNNGGGQPAADTTPPVITLNGDAAIDLVYASTYTDEGATANDDTDGNVSVTVSGDVDPFTPGVYTITYTATDAAGNQATAERVVTVENQLFRLDVSNFGDASLSLSAGSLVCNTGGDLCTAAVEAGSDITVTASPDAGWTFDAWESCDTVSSNQCTVTMDRDRVIYATSSSDAAVTYQSDVVFLSDPQIDAIVNFDADSDILFFDAGTDISGLSAGTVIVSAGTANTDAQFAKRIIDIIALPGSLIVMETINVSLDEVFASGSLTFDVEVSPTSVNQPTLPSGMSLDKRRASASAEVVPLIVTGLTLFEQDGVTVSLNGNLDVDFDPDIDAHFSVTNGLESVRFKATSEISAALSLSVSGEIATPLSFDRSFSLGTISLGTAVVSGVPVVITMEPIVTVNSALEVSVEPSVSVSQLTTVGTQWHYLSGYTNLSAYALTGGFDIPEVPTASISADIGGGARVSTRILGVAGPFLQGSLYAGGEYTLVPAEDCRLTFRTFRGARANVGGEFKVFSRRLAVETSPWFVEENLTSGTIECASDTVAPDAPADLTVTTLSDAELGLDWLEASDNYGVAFYEVWQSAGPTARAQRVATTSALSYIAAGLIPDTEYCYYVIAVDAAGNRSGVPAERVCGMTDPAADSEAPTVPSDLIISDVTASSMMLSWAPSTDNDAVVRYIVFDEGLNAAYGEAAASATPAFTARPLNPETEYCYSVAAVDASGNRSARSTIACATTEPLANAGWQALMSCVGRPVQVEQNFDLPTAGVNVVEFAGSGFDYPGTPLTYVFQGVYDAGSGDFGADITWAFQGQSQERVDRFSVNLATGDSGTVPASFVVDNGGCDLAIRIVANNGAAAAAAAAAQPSRPAGVSMTKMGERQAAFGSPAR